MMLKPFNGNVYYVTCDSVYMGDILAQVSRNEWKINMVGTIILDQTIADIKLTCNGMAKQKYDTSVWQHNTLPLCAAVWVKNAVVNTLYNFHSSVVITKGIESRGWVEDGKRFKDPAPVDGLEIMVAYYKKFNLINKGNGVESWYTMTNGGSKTHGWIAKLSFGLFNMTLNNAYKFFTCLHKHHHQQNQKVGR